MAGKPWGVLPSANRFAKWGRLTRLINLTCSFGARQCFNTSIFHTFPINSDSSLGVATQIVNIC